MFSPQISNNAFRYTEDNVNKSYYGLPSEFVCIQCDFETDAKAKMDDHMAKEHNKDAVEACPKWPDCQFKTSNKGSLDEHINETHQKMNNTHVIPKTVSTIRDHDKATKQSIQMHMNESQNGHKATEKKISIAKTIVPPQQLQTNITTELVSQQQDNPTLKARPKHICRKSCTHGLVPKHMLPDNVTPKREKQNATKEAKKPKEPKEPKKKRLIIRSSGSGAPKKKKKTVPLEVLSCPHQDCDYQNTKNNMHYHEKAVHKRIKDAACHYCEYRAYYPCQIKKHEKNVHQDEKDLSCIYCEFKTNHRQSLSTHIKAKHIKKKDLLCPQCTFATSHKSALFHHLQMGIHQPAKDITCAHCTFKTSRETLLNKHINKIHPKLKMVGCQFCGEQTSLYDSKTHFMEKHQREKSLLCEQCPFSTHFKVNLDRHVNAIHNKTKKFKCPKGCGFSTAHHGSIKSHTSKKKCLIRRSVSGQPNEGLKCPVAGCTYQIFCKESSENKLQMNKHLQSAHHIKKNFEMFYTVVKSLEETIKQEEPDNTIDYKGDENVSLGGLCLPLDQKVESLVKEKASSGNTRGRENDAALSFSGDKKDADSFQMPLEQTMEVLENTIQYFHRAENEMHDVFEKRNLYNTSKIRGSVGLSM